MFVAGIRYEQTRILKWIESNRSTIELEAGVNIYRDHFDSESLIAFIEAKDEEV
jgi:hypothetical protein